MSSLSLAPTVEILPCPTCFQTINTSMAHCAYCGTAVDPSAAQAAAERFARVNQAISDASYLKIMAGCAVTFFLLQLAPFVGMMGVVGLWFLELAIPFMTIRWWIRYARLNSDDAEFAKARRLALWLGGGVSLFFLLLNLARLLR